MDTSGLLAPIVPGGTFGVWFRDHEVSVTDAFTDKQRPDRERPLPTDAFLNALSGQWFLALRVSRVEVSTVRGSINILRPADAFDMVAFGCVGDVHASGVNIGVSVSARKPDAEEGEWNGRNILSATRGKSVPLHEVFLYDLTRVVMRLHCLYVGHRAMAAVLSRACSDEMTGGSSAMEPGCRYAPPDVRCVRAGPVRHGGSGHRLDGDGALRTRRGILEIRANGPREVHGWFRNRCVREDGAGGMPVRNTEPHQEAQGMHRSVSSARGIVSRLMSEAGRIEASENISGVVFFMRRKNRLMRVFSVLES